MLCCGMAREGRTTGTFQWVGVHGALWECAASYGRWEWHPLQAVPAPLPRAAPPLGWHHHGPLCATPLQSLRLSQSAVLGFSRRSPALSCPLPFGFVFPIWPSITRLSGGSCGLGCRAGSLCLLGPGVASPQGAGGFEIGS